MTLLDQPKRSICCPPQSLRRILPGLRRALKIALLCLTLACLTLRAAAQSIQPIYSFTNGLANPRCSLVQGPDGSFYGTTQGGGSNNLGTVFQITTNGTVTTLVTFADTNGATPEAGLTLGPDGNFYGTTANGGSNSDSQGTIFQMTTNGVVTLLYSFSAMINHTNADGAYPYAGLTLGPDGNFYGTTFQGGKGGGTVFQITTNGTLTTLATFAGTNGSDPQAGLTVGPDANLYGTTMFGGSKNYGTVFRITTNGTLVTLVVFNRTNGSSPSAGLALGPDGNFYGTTAGGGSSNYGTVFRITTNGSLTTLASFAGTNGANPDAGLTLAPDGNLYGTTEHGGSDGFGTVFQITTNGTLTTLANFASTNGANPQAGLTLGSDGNFYGDTYNGGNGIYAGGYGTIFQLSTNRTLKTLASFSNANGVTPEAGLTVGPDGNLYGTTYYGGINGYGTVFQLTTNGALTTLASFGLTNGADPAAGLALGPDGNLYGTTWGYGNANYGTVFQITTSGKLTTLTSFAYTNGANPNAALTLGPDGNFYGTTAYGGDTGNGTAFQLTTNGILTTLVDFEFTNGATPYDGLTLGPDGNFYGATTSGGSVSYGIITPSQGMIYQITTNGTVTTLASFSDTNGSVPYAGLTLGPDGSLYGTTESGGTSGNGTVFRITTNGTLTTLYSFSATVNYTNADGDYPQAGLTLGPDGNFYGTTFLGGSDDRGTVFRITTNGILTTLASFAGTNGTDPYAGLTLAPDGNFYGTAGYGGSGGGVIYRLNLPPSITTQPSNQIAAIASNATFTVTLFGTAPFAYQWLSNGTIIPDATNNALNIPNVTPSSAGNYQVIVTNAWGSVTSIIATLTLGISPTITNQPASESVPIGGIANFAAGATGTPPLAYQWYFNTNTSLAGANNAVLSFGPVLSTEAGQYQVIVTSPYGSATSSAASLTVLLQPNCYGISNSGSGSVTLLLASIPGSTNRLWATTNLSLPLDEWQPLSTNAVDTTGLFQFTDTNTGDAPAKFYILSLP